MLQRGGSAVLVHGGEFRMLWYDPRLHRSSFGLRSVLFGAGQGCELRVHESNKTGSVYPSAGTLLRTIQFRNRSEHPDAVAQFLSGAPLERNIMVSYQLV
jgi:hypothetical protein